MKTTKTTTGWQVHHSIARGFLLLLIATALVSKAGAAYIVVVSDQTWGLTAWQTVANRLKDKHQGEVLTYSGAAFPGALRQSLAAKRPDYVCFVAQAQEVTADYVRACHQMLRQLDADPYGDAVWGIVTGRTPSDADRMASLSGSLTVSNVLFKTYGPGLEYFYAGQYHTENDPPRKWTRTNGGSIIQADDPVADDTVPFVNLLNSNKVDLMLTSGHATEYEWQLHYPTPSPEGFFRASSGQLYGQDGGGGINNINSTNPKILYAAGNCLVGHIPEDASRENCLALGWLGSGGAAQLGGYIVTSWFGYMGWGVGDYFAKLQGRYTFAESFYLVNQSLLFDERHGTPGVDPTGLQYDRDNFVVYGDPAYEARVQPVTQPLYDQTLQHTLEGTTANFTLTIRMNRAENVSRIAIARLPFRISNPQVTDNGGRLVEVTDDLALVQLWVQGESDLQTNQTWTIRFSGSVSNQNPPAAVVLADNFEDGVIDTNLWVWGGALRGVGGGSWQWSHTEASGALRLRVWGPTSGNTYGSEAWVRTRFNYNNGQSHLINFTWGASVSASHIDLYAVEICNGEVEGGGNYAWFTADSATNQNLYLSTNGQANLASASWSVKIDAASRTATLYSGPDLSGAVLGTKVLDAAQPWYLRFILGDATSSGYPAGDNSMFLYDFSSVTSAPPAAVVLADNFEDGVIDTNLWVWGGALRGVGGGSWQWSHTEANGALRLRVWGPTSGNTYGSEAWVRTRFNYNNGQSHLINFTWGASVSASHIDLYAVEICNGEVEGGGNYAWFTADSATNQNLYLSTNGQANLASASWSVKIDAASRTATLYSGPDLSGAVLGTKVLDAAQPWYLRFILGDATSSGYPAGDNSMYLYDFSSASAGSVLSIASSSPLPYGTAGLAYLQTLTANGGSTPYTWTLVSGSLPPGLSLSSSGIISGTPTLATVFAFRIRATDSAALYAEKDLTINVRQQSLNPTNWIQVTGQGPWSTWWPSCRMIPFNNQLFVFGADPTNIWVSANGTNWSAITQPWPLHATPGVAVFQNKLWVAGGSDTGIVNYNDVWSSGDGTNWTQATANAGWSQRRAIGMVTFQNRLWIMGGNYRSTDYNDVWSSTDGTNWTRATAAAGWSARMEFGVIVFNNKMWLMGGHHVHDGVENDIWSSADGTNWVQVTPAAPVWGARGGFGNFVLGNKVWVIGGGGAYTPDYNDIWTSSDLVNWTQETATNPWAARYEFGRTYFNNRIWILGGINSANGYISDYWYLDVPMPPEGLDADTLALYTFEEPVSFPTALNSAGDAYHGALLNGATRTNIPGVGKVLVLDGVDDYVSIDGAILNNNPQGTIEAKVYVDTHGPHGVIVMSKGDTFLTDISVGAGPDGMIAGSMGAAPYYFIGTNMVPLNKWVKLRYTWNGTDWRMFIDDVLISVIPTTGYPPNRPNDLKIGRHNHSAGPFYSKMLIDDLRISRVARNDSKVMIGALGFQRQSNFGFNMATVSGVNYLVEVNESLVSAGWSVLTNFVGAGGTAPIIDAWATNSSRFYRIRVAQ